MEDKDQNSQVVLAEETGHANKFGWRVHFLEVFMLSYFLGYIMNFMMSVQFIYARVEADLVRKENVTLGNSTVNSQCDSKSIDNTTAQIIAEAQETSSDLQLYLSLAGGIPSILTSVVLGSTSDRFGRKFLFVLPASGALLQSVTYCVVSYWGLSLYYLIISHFVEGLTGTFITVLLASFAMTSDITGKGKKRSFQMTLMECISGITLGVANISIGFLIKDAGYTISTFPPMILTTAAIIVAAVLIPETCPKDHEREKVPISKSLYRVYHFYFTRKDDNPRDCYVICLLIFALASVAFVGSTRVETLYVLNKPLCWESVKIGYYGATKAFCQSLATIIMVKLLQYCLSDVGIAMVSGMCKAASLVLEGFATTDAYMFVVAVIAMSGISILSMTRSIMSKLTPNDKMGAMFASIASVEAVTSMVSGTVFVAIYRATLSFYDGTVFFCMATAVTISIGLCVVLYLKLKRRIPAYKRLEEPFSVNN